MSEHPAILFIHGLGLQPSKDEMLATWSEALAESLRDEPRFSAAELAMAYYSPELHPEVHIARQQGPVRRGIDAPPALDAKTVTTVENQLLDELMKEYNLSAEETLAEVGAATPQVRTGALRDLTPLTPLTPVELSEGQSYPAFIRDVIKYFALGHREPVNAKLIEQLDALGDRPILLLSHSLGTIVSYDVLTAGDYHVDTWITCGSPLGFVQDVERRIPGWLDNLSPATIVKAAELGGQAEEVLKWATETIDKAKSKLTGIFHRPARRGGVEPERAIYDLPQQTFPDGKVDRWYNIFDPRDPVAHPKFGDATLADEYLSGGVQRVYDITVKNPREGPHSIEGYLETLQMSWLVKDFLTRCS